MQTLENVEGMSLDALEAGLPWSFETYPEYLRAVAAEPIRLNVASMIGHTPLRTWAMGEEATQREATAAELDEMRRLVAEALEVGAVGFSTLALGVPPGRPGAARFPAGPRPGRRSSRWPACSARGDGEPSSRRGARTSSWRSSRRWPA